MTEPAAKTHGWGISLRYRGLGLTDRAIRDGLPLRLGEDPTCTLVVPGLGGAVPLAIGDRLQHVPGLTGTVHRDGLAQAFGPELADAVLTPGDHAELQLVEHPEITLELRRQAFERLPLATLINLRELGRQCILGAGLIAGMILLVRIEDPVNVLEVKGDPDELDDSALIRAMFAVAYQPAPPVVDLRWVSPPPPVPEPVPEPAPEVLAPMPLAVVEEAPTPVMSGAKVERRKGERRLSGKLAVIGATGDAASLWGGEGTISDLLVEADVDRALIGSVVGEGGGGYGEGVLGDDAIAVGTGLRAIGTVIEAPTEVPTEAPTEELAEVPDSVAFVEDIMGPGVEDPPPVPLDIPSSELGAPGGVVQHPGTDSHTRDGAEEVFGVAGGVLAVAPDAKCDDPTIVQKRQLDLVFVVDVSTTMTFMLDRIEKQIGQVDAEARVQGLDVRYGLVVFVDDVQLGNQGQAYADLAALQADLARWQAFTAGNREINSTATNLDWPENSLDALHTAATGFAWRPADTTLRMVVHATDDDFGEAPAVQSGQTVRHTYLETITALRDAEVRMFSFAAKVGGQCECLDVRPGLFTRYKGRPSLPDATGGGVFDIDEVARGKLGFSAVVAGAIKSGVCTRYPLSPFAPSRRSDPSTAPRAQ